MTDKINKFLDKRGIKRGYGIMQEKTNEWIKISDLLVEFEALNQHNVIPRTCSTCAHKSGMKCMLSGHYVETEREYPTVCGENFEGWKKRLGFIKRIKFWLYGV